MTPNPRTLNIFEYPAFYGKKRQVRKSKIKNHFVFPNLKAIILFHILRQKLSNTCFQLIKNYIFGSPCQKTV